MPGIDRQQRSAVQWFGLLWLLGSLILVVQGHGLLLALTTAAALFWGLHTWLSVRITKAQSSINLPGTANTQQLWFQVGVILLFAAIANQPLPLWSNVVDWLRILGERLLPGAWVGGPGNAVANPVQYFVLPLSVLLVLGARPGELGLRLGDRTWRVCAIWLLLPGITFGVLLILGQLPAQTVARRFIGNALQNGFFEEFLFRGALQSRLLRLGVRPVWALVTQALLFGLWHMNANLRLFAGDWLSALAWSIVSQAVIGLFFGLLFHRTGSLIAPSVAHVVTNAVGQTFG